MKIRGFAFVGGVDSGGSGRKGGKEVGVGDGGLNVNKARSTNT